MISNLCAWYSGTSRSSLIRHLESLIDPFAGDQGPWRLQKRVWCSEQATWCSAEETGRTIQRRLCAYKNLLGLPYHSVECERSFSVLLCQLTHNRLQSRLNHELVPVAHSARPVDLDGVIEALVRFNDQRKDDFGLQTSWQQCQTPNPGGNVSVALLQCECVIKVIVMNLMVVSMVYFCDAW